MICWETAVFPFLAKQHKGDFPQCLNGEPLIIPSDVTAIRGHLLRWFEQLHIHPRIVGEFDDSALMKAFGGTGVGTLIAPIPIARKVEKQYDVVVTGQTDDVRAHFYAISAERKLSHPAMPAITKTAREWLTANSKKRHNKKKSRK